MKYQGEHSGGDYSEEAIPERDPAYRLPAGTDYQGPTVEAVSPAERLELERCLRQLGMSEARSVFVASL
jgi:hypothetical protein